jgi:hypothetical protein
MQDWLKLEQNLRQNNKDNVKHTVMQEHKQKLQLFNKKLIVVSIVEVQILHNKIKPLLVVVTPLKTLKDKLQLKQQLLEQEHLKDTHNIMLEAASLRCSLGGDSGHSI